ncbi:zinc ribbon-containing protein, partial [Vibrio mediterranei]|uniref:zinc ribbon-containing protein n=1 Tax=Vibrio mediterranei TaxID=689 RepID=UPI00406818AA
IELISASFYVRNKAFVQTHFILDKAQGVYSSGEMIGLGILVCEQCGHKTEYNHPTTISDCPKCGHSTFSRQPLKP